MNKRKALIAAALAGVCVLTVAVADAKAMETDKKNPQEKCYGVAKAGQNDCSSKDGSHSCAGQATVDNDKNEWKHVAKGTCVKAGGKVETKSK